MRKVWIISAVLATLSGTVGLAQAQDSTTAQDSSTAQDSIPHDGHVTLGGHIGFVLPLATWSGGQTTNLADQFSIGFPVGITVKGSGRTAFDLELDPFINTTGTHTTTLTVAPGLLWSVGHGWTVGMRAAFDVNAASWGFTPLLNHSWPIKREGSFFKTYFVEADLPVRFNRTVGQPATDPVSFAMHFGLGF